MRWVGHVTCIEEKRTVHTVLCGKPGLQRKDNTKIPYILETKPHPFYSFRGLKNQVRIRFAVVSWNFGIMIEPLYVP